MPHQRIVHCHYGGHGLRIGQALGMQFWLNLQRMYDLDIARASTDTSAIKPLVDAASIHGHLQGALISTWAQGSLPSPAA